jgi:hypothetical protein
MENLCRTRSRERPKDVLDVQRIAAAHLGDEANELRGRWIEATLAHKSVERGLIEPGEREARDDRLATGAGDEPRGMLRRLWLERESHVEENLTAPGETRALE